MMRCCSRPLALLAALALPGLFALVAPAANADPCGMVPPFYRNGVETFVIRPGFSGKVEDFGMLIPFPSVPAMRKVDDATFSHIAAAIDPPEVLVNLSPPPPMAAPNARGGGPTADGPAEGALNARDEVRVLKEEAIGMYEVVVLAAGSAAALQKWMDAHGYHYPDGMDKACEEYVAAGWCFVAVKTRVSRKAAVDPQPGMRDVEPGLAPGGSFDGNVQAMGFRFRVPQLVVPMRLSSFNAGDLHNIVYLLTDKPVNIRNTPNGHVRRQLSGEQLYKNVTELLPLHIIGGTLAQVPAAQLEAIDAMRDPRAVNGLARELFAFDLLASAGGNLSHPHEEREKDLLSIGEALDLRGPEIDSLNHHELAELRKTAGESALNLLKTMTLTVWDGDFDREMLGRENLTFVGYEMPAAQNSLASYNAIQKAELADWADKTSVWNWRNGWGGPMMIVPGLVGADQGQVIHDPVSESGKKAEAERKRNSQKGPGEKPAEPISAADPVAGGKFATGPKEDEAPPVTFDDVPSITKVWMAAGLGALILVLVFVGIGWRTRAAR